MPKEIMTNPRCLARAGALLLVIGAFLAVTAAGGEVVPSEKARPEATMVLVTRADAEKTVEVGLDEEIAVLLDENPTTGFSWTVEPTDSTVLALKASDFSPAASDGLGAGGQRTFSFQPRHAGIATLNFLLGRPWQGETAPPVEHFTVIIRVR